MLLDDTLDVPVVDAPTLPPKKVRITIRLDAEILDWFREKARGGGSYQGMINDALQAYMAQSDTFLEDLVRRVVREELERVI